MNGDSVHSADFGHKATFGAKTQSSESVKSSSNGLLNSINTQRSNWPQSVADASSASSINRRNRRHTTLPETSNSKASEDACNRSAFSFSGPIMSKLRHSPAASASNDKSLRWTAFYSHELQHTQSTENTFMMERSRSGSVRSGARPCADRDGSAVRSHSLGDGEKHSARRSTADHHRAYGTGQKHVERQKDTDRQEAAGATMGNVSQPAQSNSEVLRHELLRAKDILTAREEARAEYCGLLAAKNEQVNALYAELVDALSQNGMPVAAPACVHPSMPFAERIHARRASTHARPSAQAQTADCKDLRLVPQVLVDHVDQVHVSSHSAPRPEPKFDGRVSQLDLTQYIRLSSPKLGGHRTERPYASSPQGACALSAPSPSLSPSLLSPHARRQSAANGHVSHAVPHLLPREPSIPIQESPPPLRSEVLNAPARRCGESPLRAAVRVEPPLAAPSVPTNLWPSSFYLLSPPQRTTRAVTAQQQRAPRNGATMPLNLADRVADTSTYRAKPSPSATSGAMMTPLWAASRAGRKHVAHDVCSHIWGSGRDGGSMASTARPHRPADGSDVGGGSVGNVPRLNMASPTKTIGARQELWCDGARVGNELEDRGACVPLVAPRRGGIDVMDVRQRQVCGSVRMTNELEDRGARAPMRSGELHEPLCSLDLPPQDNPRFAAPARRASRAADERPEDGRPSTPSRSHGPYIASQDHLSPISSSLSHTIGRNANQKPWSIEDTPLNTGPAPPSGDEIRECTRVSDITRKHLQVPAYADSVPCKAKLRGSFASGLDLGPLRHLSEPVVAESACPASATDAQESPAASQRGSSCRKSKKSVAIDDSTASCTRHAVKDPSPESGAILDDDRDSTQYATPHSDGRLHVRLSQVEEVSEPCMPQQSTLGIQDDATTLLGSGNCLPSGVSDAPFSSTGQSAAGTTPTFDNDLYSRAKRGNTEDVTSSIPQVVVMHTDGMEDATRPLTLGSLRPRPANAPGKSGAVLSSVTPRGSNMRTSDVSRDQGFRISLEPSLQSKSPEGFLHSGDAKDWATVVTGLPASMCPTVIPGGLSPEDHNELLLSRLHSRLSDDHKYSHSYDTRSPVASLGPSVTGSPISAPDVSSPVFRSPLSAPDMSSSVIRSPLSVPKKSLPVVRSPLSAPEMTLHAFGDASRTRRRSDSISADLQFHSLPDRVTDMSIVQKDAPPEHSNKNTARFMSPQRRSTSVPAPVFATMGPTIHAKNPPHTSTNFDVMTHMSQDMGSKERTHSQRRSQKEKKTKYRKPRPAPLRDNNPGLKSFGNIFNHFTRPVSTTQGAGAYLAGLRSKMTTPAGGRGQNLLHSRALASRALASRGFAASSRKPTDGPRDRARTVVSKSKPAVHHASLFFDNFSSYDSNSSQEAPISVHTPKALERELDRSLQHAISTFQNFRARRENTPPATSDENGSKKRQIQRRATFEDAMWPRCASMNESNALSYDGDGRTTRDTNSIAHAYGSSIYARRSSWTAGERLNLISRVFSSEMNKPLETIPSYSPSSAATSQARSAHDGTRSRSRVESYSTEAVQERESHGHTDGTSDAHWDKPKNAVRETCASFATPVKKDAWPAASQGSPKHDPRADPRADTVALTRDSMARLRSPRPTQSAPKEDGSDEDKLPAHKLQLNRKRTLGTRGTKGTVGTVGTVHTSTSGDWAALEVASSPHRQQQVSIWVPTRMRSPEGSCVLLSPGMEDDGDKDAGASALNGVRDAALGGHSASSPNRPHTMADSATHDTAIPEAPSDARSSHPSLRSRDTAATPGLVCPLQRHSTTSSFAVERPPLSPESKRILDEDLDTMIDGLVSSVGCMVFPRESRSDNDISGTCSPAPYTE